MLWGGGRGARAGESPAERAGVGFVLRQTGTLMLRGLPEALPRVLEGQLSSLEAVGDRILAGGPVLPAGGGVADFILEASSNGP